MARAIATSRGGCPSSLGRSDIKVISCHLGGSSSLCAIRNGKSVACSLGMSPQSGLPHNNRVGDFDVFALPVILRETGKSLEEVLDILANQSGLEGLCGGHATSATSRAAADGGDARAELAIDVFVASIRHYLGAYLLELGGADVIVFTGGIGENSARIRAGRLPRPRAGSASRSTRPERRRPGRATWSPPTARASRSGPCRPTRKSWWRGRPATCSNRVKTSTD